MSSFIASILFFLDSFSRILIKYMLNLHILSSISLIFTIFLSDLHSRYFLIHFMFLSSTVSNPLSFKFQQIYFSFPKFWWILFHVFLIILDSLFYDFIFYFFKQLDYRVFFFFASEI